MSNGRTTKASIEYLVLVGCGYGDGGGVLFRRLRYTVAISMVMDILNFGFGGGLVVIFWDSVLYNGFEIYVGDE